MKFRFTLAAILLVAAHPLSAATPLPRPRLTGMAHVAFFAHDVEQTCAFYHDFLGYETVWTLPGAGGRAASVWIKINDRQYVEILPEYEAGSDRLARIGIETDDAAAMCVYLAAHGVTVPARVAKEPGGDWEFDVTDPDGHLVRFVQYAPDSWSQREQGKHLGAGAISRRLSRPGILVADLDRANRFYGEILGCREIWRGGRKPGEVVWVKMLLPDGGTHCDNIEYVVAAKFPPQDKRGKPHHIILDVPDVEKSFAALAPRSALNPPVEPMKIGGNSEGQWLLNLYDPDGTRIELLESVPRGQKPPVTK